MTHPNESDQELDGVREFSSPLEEQLLDEMTLLRTIIGALGEAVIITDPELDAPGPYIQYVNPAFTRLTGYAPHEVLGQTPRILRARTPTAPSSMIRGRH
ncbi:PAS domain-containing protein [Belnapia moabensis]|uniref:PAS domain-containing protein n=1 Tax=Belnapia moabensis TaxID=365533 RepID=UPI001B800328|nr:PAS domain-containing protein [Belnapia moabensis]